ncbi:hypothetical protein [Sulfobacillus thermosulfidooxidans]|nr:hypothetical protein [Sulfobacillus thermosulfidooxidans]
MPDDGPGCREHPVVEVLAAPAAGLDRHSRARCPGYVLENVSRFPRSKT